MTRRATIPERVLSGRAQPLLLIRMFLCGQENRNVKAKNALLHWNLHKPARCLAPDSAFAVSLAYGVLGMVPRVLCSLDCNCSNAVFWCLGDRLRAAIVFIVRFPVQPSSHPSSRQHITAINSPVFSTHRRDRDATQIAFIVAVLCASTYPKDLIMRLTSIHKYTRIAPVRSKRLSRPRVVKFVVVKYRLVDSY